MRHSLRRTRSQGIGLWGKLRHTRSTLEVHLPIPPHPLRRRLVRLDLLTITLRAHVIIVLLVLDLHVHVPLHVVLPPPLVAWLVGISLPPSSVDASEGATLHICTIEVRIVDGRVPAPVTINSHAQGRRQHAKSAAIRVVRSVPLKALP